MTAADPRPVGVPTEPTGGRRLLAIYGRADCPGWATARVVAARLAALPLPDVEVRLVDLADPNAVRHPSVFAVPTYLLDDAVIALGNPDPEWLLARLAAPVDP